MALEANVAKNPLYLSHKVGKAMPEPTLKKTARNLALKSVRPENGSGSQCCKKTKNKSVRKSVRKFELKLT